MADEHSRASKNARWPPGTVAGIPMRAATKASLNTTNSSTYAGWNRFIKPV